MTDFSGHWALAFGLLGNIASLMVFLAPISTFYQIYKKKSSEGFQSIPYVVALFSAVLWVYYALLKSNTTLLITINSVGCVIETIYIVLYVYYASKPGRVQTLKLLTLFMSCVGGLIGVTHFLVKSPEIRTIIVGWICLIFCVCVFVAPLCILRQVIRTKSVEHMPFLLSFVLTLSGFMWFFYGLLLKDFNIAIPNVIGFTIGILQMMLYLMYKNAKKPEDQKLPQIQQQVMVLDEHNNVEIVKISTVELGSDNIPVVAQLVCRNGVEAVSLPQTLPKECEV